MLVDGRSAIDTGGSRDRSVVASFDARNEHFERCARLIALPQGERSTGVSCELMTDGETDASATFLRALQRSE